MADDENCEPLREIFLSNFSLEQYLAGMAAAVRSIETL
jgi:hypothetical protein